MGSNLAIKAKSNFHASVEQKNYLHARATVLHSELPEIILNVSLLAPRLTKLGGMRMQELGGTWRNWWELAGTRRNFGELVTGKIRELIS